LGAWSPPPYWLELQHRWCTSCWPARAGRLNH